MGRAGRAVAALLLALAGTGCGPSFEATPPPAFLASVDTPDGQAGVFRDARGLHLLIDRRGSGSTRVPTEPPMVHLYSLSGETGRTYNSFVWGLAPVGATTVELRGFETLGGDVVEGTFVLAMEDKDVQPKDLRWTFRSATGTVVASGSNITP